MDDQHGKEQAFEENGGKEGNHAVVGVTQTVITIDDLLFNLEKKSTKKSKRQVGIEELKRVIEEAGDIVDIEAAELDIQIEEDQPAFPYIANPIVMLNIETEEPKAADISPAQFDSQPGTPKLPWEQVVIPKTLESEPVVATINTYTDTGVHRVAEAGVQVTLPADISLDSPVPDRKGISIIPDFISDDMGSPVSSPVASHPKPAPISALTHMAIATQTGNESQEVEIHVQGKLVGHGIDITSAYATLIPVSGSTLENGSTSKCQKDTNGPTFPLLGSESPEFSSQRIRSNRRAVVRSESPTMMKAPPPSSYSPKRKKKRKNRLIVNPILRHLGADSSSVFRINTTKSKAEQARNRFTYNGKSSGRDSSVTFPPIFTTEVSRSYTDCKTTSSRKMFSVNLTKYQAAHINYETDLLEKSFSPFRCTKVVKLQDQDSATMGIPSRLDETPRSDSESPVSRQGAFKIQKRSLRRL